MILVADASALIALSACDKLALLDALFGEVVVPEAVYREVAVAGKPESVRLQSYLQGKVRSVNMQNFVYLDAFADAGETAAMLLYKEIAADYLLVDDKRGRKVAQINQIKTIGSLGVLLQAKRVGLIPAVAPLLSQIARSPIFLTKELLKTVLELAGEDLEALGPDPN
jgi:predicted nucleic acid-binding protein